MRGDAVGEAGHDQIRPADAFESTARPLLKLVQEITGLETTFLTAIDWEDQTQRVVLALSSGDLEVVEGTVIEWSDSMCRWAFLDGRQFSTDVPSDFPDSIGEQLGMQTFFALAIATGDGDVGTICGASRRVVELDERAVDLVRLVGEALTHHLAAQWGWRRDRRRAEDAETLAMTDSLTGLDNLRAFTARVEQELSRAGRHGSDLALLSLDIDAFKAVNDTLGHLSGDRILDCLAGVLQRCARDEDLVARVGGDEFAMVLVDADPIAAAQVADRLAREFALASIGIGIPATVSVGWSSTATSTLRSLREDADGAMYASKRHRASQAPHAQAPLLDSRRRSNGSEGIPT